MTQFPEAKKQWKPQFSLHYWFCAFCDDNTIDKYSRLRHSTGVQLLDGNYIEANSSSAVLEHTSPQEDISTLSHNVILPTVKVEYNQFLKTMRIPETRKFDLISGNLKFSLTWIFLGKLEQFFVMICFRPLISLLSLKIFEELLHECIHWENLFISFFNWYSMRLYRQTEFMPHLPISLSSVTIVDGSEIVWVLYVCNKLQWIRL